MGREGVKGKVMGNRGQRKEIEKRGGRFERCMH